MSNIILKNNILYYFLISSLHPKKKIYELINTKDKTTYIEAQEILGIYINKGKLDFERTKIESRNNAFHIFITNKQLIFISYSNKKYFSSEKNFELFDDINNYLINNMKDRMFDGHSFLVEDEKEEIKDIIKQHIEEIISSKTIDYYLGSGDTENENENEKIILQVDSNNKKIIEEKKSENEDNNDNKNSNKNIITKKLFKNFSQSSIKELNEKTIQDKEKKNESSQENIIKKKITNSFTLI